MNIAEAARQADLSIDTIRYYDKLGILGSLSRTAGGARTFTKGDVGWLRIVSRYVPSPLSPVHTSVFCMS